jgi:hypothetical protein
MSQWKTDTEPARCFIDECPSSKEAKDVQINIERDVWHVLVGLTKEIKLEWQAFLCGTEENGVVQVNGYWIPKQKVTGSTVENLDIIDAAVVQEKRIVASIHSHAEMTVFHSGTDMESTCKSKWIKHHITINNELKYVAKSQYVLGCGKIAFIDAKVCILGQEPRMPIPGIENIETPKVGAYLGWGTHGGATGRSYDDDDMRYKSHQDKVDNDHKDEKPTSVSMLHRFNRYNDHGTKKGMGLSHV